MLPIADIYTQYHIFRGLQQHMLRVAAVAKIICDALKIEKSEYIISACLLHDMGNIIKSELTKFPEFLEPEGIGYWTQVKQDFIEKYGNDTHKATLKIAKDIDVSEETQTLINAIGFSQIAQIHEHNILFEQICSYADMRVGPSGILPLDQRFDDLKVRYNTSYAFDEENFEKMRGYLYEFEKTIFTNLGITPDTINDTTCQPIIEELRKYSIV